METQNNPMETPTPPAEAPKHKGGRPKGRRNRTTLEVAAWARGLLADPVYRRNLRQRLRDGTAGQIEVVLHHYAYGKPVERVELTSPRRVLILAPGAVLPPALEAELTQAARETPMPAEGERDAEEPVRRGRDR